MSQLHENVLVWTPVETGQAYRKVSTVISYGRRSQGRQTVRSEDNRIAGVEGALPATRLSRPRRNLRIGRLEVKLNALS